MSDNEKKTGQDPNESPVKKFLNDAIAALSSLTRLDVHTLVGNYTFTKVDKFNTIIDVDSTEERMSSQINLFTGDIKTAMTPKFVDEYNDLREFHQKREEEGHQIIENNIETLKKIFNTLDFFDKKNNEGTEPDNEE